MQPQNLYDVIVYLLQSIGVWQPIYDLFNNYGLAWLLNIIIYAVEGAVLFGVVGVAVLALTYLERKALADIQIRMGPNVTGPVGLLQPLADGIKLVMKENITPKNVTSGSGGSLHLLFLYRHLCFSSRSRSMNFL